MKKSNSNLVTRTTTADQKLKKTGTPPPTKQNKRTLTNQRPKIKPTQTIKTKKQ